MPLVDVLSVDRISTYLGWAAYDMPIAERLYTYNVQLSAEFYGSLHMFEVALRNRCDHALTEVMGTNWFRDDTVLQDQYQKTCVSSATQILLKQNKTANHSQMIAELNLGFWSSLFGKSSNHLWGTLRPIFNHQGLQRKMISGRLREIRLLRNRIAHYEPILALPIGNIHSDVLKLTSWLSVDASAWILSYSTVNYPATSIIVKDPTTGVAIFDRALVGYLPV